MLLSSLHETTFRESKYQRREHPQSRQEEKKRNRQKSKKWIKFELLKDPPVGQATFQEDDWRLTDDRRRRRVDDGRTSAESCFSCLMLFRMNLTLLQVLQQEEGTWGERRKRRPPFILSDRRPKNWLEAWIIFQPWIRHEMMEVSVGNNSAYSDLKSSEWQVEITCVLWTIREMCKLEKRGNDLFDPLETVNGSLLLGCSINSRIKQFLMARHPNCFMRSIGFAIEFQFPKSNETTWFPFDSKMIPESGILIALLQECHRDLLIQLLETWWELNCN